MNKFSNYSILVSRKASEGIKLTKPFEVVAKVVELRETDRGPCPKFKIGQEFDISPNENHVPREPLCRWAYHSLFPFSTIIEFGGEIYWEKDPHVAHVSCPDPFRVVVFEISRKEKKS